VKVSLQAESEKLSRCWMQHESAWLRDYLVPGVEDPRINLQSILSRHFLTESIFGERLHRLMNHECRFGAAMNWLQDLARRGGGTEEYDVVLHALKQQSDNAEGLEIPWFLLEAFGQLPTEVDGLMVPNYIEQFLLTSQAPNVSAIVSDNLSNTFRDLWLQVLSAISDSTQPPPENRITPDSSSTPAARRLSVLEPACGSANDYRFFDAFGLARWLDYSGFDLCVRNIENARVLFPDIRFQVGNVFEIGAPDKAFDLTIVHDLFEHLSLEGLQVAINEICRVTRLGICVGFFQMEEIRDHVVRPLNDYYCNLLSMRRTKEAFAAGGFSAQVIHIGTFLGDQLGCDLTHNPNAYTFLMRAA
jgi:SAM-dependent methyltransferase